MMVSAADLDPWVWHGQPILQAAMIVVGSLVLAWLIELAFAKLAGWLAKRTTSKFDDQLVEVLRRPIFVSVLLYGLHWATEVMQLPARLGDPLAALLRTLAIVTWAVAGARVGSLILQTIAARDREGSLLRPRTAAIFDISLRFGVAAIAMYFMFLAWDVDLTAWLASAGIIGIALAWAAKDALADTFAGILIFAYGPYEVHDWIVLDNGVRGEVIHIGLRTTRIMTAEDVEVLVRNGLIANGKITNESKGRYCRQRVRVGFVVSYGNDVEHIRELVVAASQGAAHILDRPENAAPTVRLRRLGPRGLEFELSVWIEEPGVREAVVDEMTTRLYEALTAAEIELPSPKRDVRIKTKKPGLRPDPRAH